MKNPGLRRIFLYVLIASVSVSALTGIGVILFGEFGSLEVRIILSTLTITATSVLGLACGAYLESGKGRVLPIFGLLCTFAAAIMSLFIIWDVWDDWKEFIKVATTMLLLAVSASHLSLLSLATLDKRFMWSRKTVFVCVGILDALLLYILWFEPEKSEDLVPRVMGVLGIVIAAITVATPVFHRLSARESNEADLDTEIEQLRARIADLEQQKRKLKSAASAETQTPAE